MNKLLDVMCGYGLSLIIWDRIHNKDISQDRSDKLVFYLFTSYFVVIK